MNGSDCTDLHLSFTIRPECFFEPDDIYIGVGVKDEIEVPCNEGVAPLYTIIRDVRVMRPPTIASETDAKVTGSSPSFEIRKGSAESTQKGGTGRVGAAVIFARREPYLDSFRVVVGLREDN
ncbi:hypothetical protein PIB30_054685 [Stylosanthes scabra]|uniref:Uncharacterized protein n=1 Tax=Stylosanthes scabra TaxID=79078 RepID=A0ABU6TJS1_9FABA|nr:hypothetical protein [Stylosanthes scabra]